MACRDEAIVVPRDLSIIGFDDIPLARYVTPPLTTICQPRRELGRSAMHILLALLDGRPGDSRTLAPTLVQRASAAAPDAGK
jgi:LacI family transcriptional regulator/LacI family repressor for deo operon, udp, cdd, tsx, nupC, and nupG